MKFWPLMIIAALVLPGCASTPLEQAVKKSDKAAVESLLAHGAKLEQADSHGRTPLGLAAEAGNKEMVDLLLSHGASPTTRPFFHSGNSPFHLAAEKGRTDLVRLFISKGVKVNFLNRQRQTALMLAAWARQTETVTYLLDNGANPKLGDQYGWTALHSTFRTKPTDVFYRQIMEDLISHGGPVNAETAVPYGYTPLMSACVIGDEDVVNLLLKSGAKVDAMDQSGNTPYTMALRTHHQDILAILTQHGAKAPGYEFSDNRPGRKNAIEPVPYEDPNDKALKELVPQPEKIIENPVTP